MRVPRIYTAQRLDIQQEIDLEAEPSHHIVKVLRMTEGRALIVFNGDGHEYEATLVSAGKKSTRIALGGKRYFPNQSPLNSELAIGLSKGDRFDWVLQKATELGATTITPLFTERNEVKLSGERLEKKIASWQKILVSACEQSHRNVLPILNPPQFLDHYIAACTAELKLVLHHRSEKTLGEMEKPETLAILIGPEGGLSESEIMNAESAGFTALSFGNRVLRTETAPIAALSVTQYLWGDLALT